MKIESTQQTGLSEREIIGSRILEAINREEFLSLSKTQEKLIKQGMDRILDSGGLDKLTPAAIRGLYMIVTEHVWPSEFDEVSSHLDSPATPPTDGVKQKEAAFVPDAGSESNSSVGAESDASTAQSTQSGSLRGFSASNLKFCRRAIPANVRSAAIAAAHTISNGAEYYGELYSLAVQKVKVRWVSEQSIQTDFAHLLTGDFAIDPAQVICINWMSWFIPMEFAGEFDGAVYQVNESILIDVPTLMSDEFDSSDPPFIAYADSNPTTETMPAKIFAGLRDLIMGEWREGILDYYENDHSILASVNPKLRPAIARVLRKGWD